MFFLGFDFLSDRFCYQPIPLDLTDINDITIKEGIYNHVNATKDTNFELDSNIPTEWNFETQLDADFEGKLTAGNVDYVVSQITALVVKRKLRNTFEWATLWEVPVSKVEDVNFVKYDFLAKQDTEYDYSIVPVIGNIEGEYIINTIKSQFNGVYVTDGINNYKFLENVSYGNIENVSPTGVYEPYGSKYPIVVKNGNINYDRGSISGDIMVIDSNGELNRKDTLIILNSIKDFLNNPNAKILKDFNGNIWLVSIVDSINSQYYSELGMGAAKLSFNWIEIGDALSNIDLANNNLILSAN